MASKKRQQTIAKRNRERAVEEKRTLKRLRKQEKREAARTGERPDIESPLDGEQQPALDGGEPHPQL
jgi:hypothetical protein